MINTGRFADCACVRRGNPLPLCDGVLAFEEKGKKVRLVPKQGEEAAALVIDNCVCKDDHPKCDGLFLLKGNNRYWIILVELKGGEIERAFKQLAFVRHRRPEYTEIAEVFADNQPLHIIHSAFVISNHMISKQVHQRLENTFQVRVRKILFSEAAKPIPDLRKHL